MTIVQIQTVSQTTFSDVSHRVICYNKNDESIRWVGDRPAWVKIEMCRSIQFTEYSPSTQAHVFSVIVLRRKVTARSSLLAVLCDILQCRQPNSWWVFRPPTEEMWDSYFIQIGCAVFHSTLLPQFLISIWLHIKAWCLVHYKGFRIHGSFLVNRIAIKSSWNTSVQFRRNRPN